MKCRKARSESSTSSVWNSPFLIWCLLRDAGNRFNRCCKSAVKQFLRYGWNPHVFSVRSFTNLDSMVVRVSERFCKGRQQLLTSRAGFLTMQEKPQNVSAASAVLFLG